MIIHLNGAKEDITFDFAVSSDALDISSSETKYLGDVKVSGKLSYIGGGYLAGGCIEIGKKFLCDRCLKEVETSAKLPFEEKFASYETEDATLFSGDEINLTEIVRDIILSSEPISHLCKENCKGLCKICGKDLNEGDCACDRRTVDPRFSVLENLKI